MSVTSDKWYCRKHNINRLKRFVKQVLHVILASEVQIMAGVRLSQELEQKLTLLSNTTGRTKTYYIKKALEEYLEDQEDIMLAIARTKQPDEFYSLQELDKILGL